MHTADAAKSTMKEPSGLSDRIHLLDDRHALGHYL